MKNRSYWTALVDELIQHQIETNDCDFKAALSEDSDRLKEHINAFGNSPQGGAFIFGIDTGVKPYRHTGPSLDYAGIEHKISNLAHGSQEPALGVEAFVIGSKLGKVLCLYICEGTTRPVFIKDRSPLGGRACFKRLGASTVPIAMEEIRALLASASGHSYDESPVEEAGITELDYEMIRGIIPGIGPEISQKKNIPILLDHKIIKGSGNHYKPSLAGYLVFGKTLESNRQCNNARIEFQQFRDSTRALPIKKVTITGTLSRQIEAAIGLLMQHLWVRPVIKNGKREERPSCDENIIREIVTNALVHRDYTLMHQPVKIALFQDRVEVENPGGLLPGLTPLNVIHKRSWRNPLLANLVKKTGYGEMDGQGIDRIYEISRRIHLPMPIFRDEKTSFIAILSGPKAYAELSPEQKRVSLMVLLAIERVIDNEMVRNYFDITAEQARVLLKAMAADEIIEPLTRSRKFARYRLTARHRELLEG